MPCQIIIFFRFACFSLCYTRVMGVYIIPEHFFPYLDNGLIVSKDNIIRIQLNHFLQANHYNVHIIPRKIEQSLDILIIERLRIDHIAVPCDNVCAKLFISAVFHLLQNFRRNVILKICDGI